MINLRKLILKKRAFYRVFDEYGYAKAFLNGDIWTQPISNQSKIDQTNPRFDENEGLFEDIIKITKGKEIERYTKLGNDFVYLNNKILKFCRANEAYLHISSTYKCNSLSVTFINTSDKERGIDVIKNSFKFGKYFVIFDFPTLSIPLRTKYNAKLDFINYNDNLSLGPFVKRKKYELEQEIRFIFPNISEFGHVFKIEPLFGKIISTKTLTEVN